MPDHNEAMRLADRISPETDWYEFDQVTWCNEAAALLRQQAERIAELEKMQDESSDVEASLRDQLAETQAERDQHQATATALIALLADIRKACGDNGKRMQPELVEFIGAMSAERDQLRAEVERMDFIEKEFGDVLLLELAKDLPRADMPFREAIDAARTTHKETE